jgi:hypothetical protein
MNMTQSITALALVVGISVVSGLGCPPPPPMDPVSEATCAETCAHWETLGCPEAAPTPSGDSCVKVCENVLSSGGLMYWNLDCRSKVKSCGEIDDCED